MSRSVALLLLVWLLRSVSCLVQFINPPPSGKIGDFSGNPIYAAGSTVNIAWTDVEEGKGVSIVLYQLNMTNGVWFGDMEYLTQGAIGVTRYSWLVGTRKNLSTSSMFYLSIYQEGKGVSDSNSHYFNIRDRDATVVSTSSSSESPNSIPSAALSSKPEASPTMSSLTRASTQSEPSSLPSTNEPANVPSSATQATSLENSSSSIPVAAKIGIGIGVSAALAVGIGTGFLLFRRNKIRGNTTTAMTSAPPNENQHHTGSCYNSALNEAPLKSPVELHYYGDHYAAHHKHEAKGNGKSGDGVVRYEL